MLIDLSLDGTLRTSVDFKQPPKCNVDFSFPARLEITDTQWPNESTTHFHLTAFHRDALSSIQLSLYFVAAPRGSDICESRWCLTERHLCVPEEYGYGWGYQAWAQDLNGWECGTKSYAWLREAKYVVDSGYRTLRNTQRVGISPQRGCEKGINQYLEPKVDDMESGLFLLEWGGDSWSIRYKRTEYDTNRTPNWIGFSFQSHPETAEVVNDIDLTETEPSFPGWDFKIPEVFSRASAFATLASVALSILMQGKGSLWHRYHLTWAWRLVVPFATLEALLILWLYIRNRGHVGSFSDFCAAIIIFRGAKFPKDPAGATATQELSSEIASAFGQPERRSQQLVSSLAIVPILFILIKLCVVSPVPVYMAYTVMLLVPWIIVQAVITAVPWGVSDPARIHSIARGIVSIRSSLKGLWPRKELGQMLTDGLECYAVLICLYFAVFMIAEWRGLWLMIGLQLLASIMITALGGLAFRYWHTKTWVVELLCVFTSMAQIAFCMWMYDETTAVKADWVDWMS